MRTRRGLLLPVAAVLALAGSRYRSASVDEKGQLHILLESGKEIAPPKEKGQVGFDDPKIAPDGHTAGWLVMYPNPTVTYYQGAQIAGALVMYHDGRVLHTFRTQQVFWDWQFQKEGERVAYSTGPTHGGAAECVLRDVSSGRVVATWQVQRGAEPPDWARTLRQ